jgi:antitoxin component YwqK of YwqJK toxin-antitoxin module
MLIKFLISFFPLLLLSFFCAAQTVDRSAENYKAYYYENGNISSEGYLENGKPNGYWITYYPNQLRESEGNRKNFQLDGKWKFYRENGNLKTIIPYNSEVKDGKVLHYENCFLVKEEPFVEGKKEGLQTEYYADSSNKIKRTVPFENNVENGIAYHYGKDGRLIELVTYKSGFVANREKINRKDDQGRKQGVWKTYYSNKRLETERRYKDDLLNGYVKYYNPDGKLEKAELYIDGVKQEGEENKADFTIQKTYHENGVVKEMVSYNMAGKKDGISKSFDKDGNIIEAAFYKNGYLLAQGGIIDQEGLFQGKWENYYLNGNLKSKGEYKDGKKFGKWTYYFTNGEVEQEGYFNKNGEYTGEWKWYYENGNLLRKEEYKRGKREGFLEEYSIDSELITKGDYFDGEKEGPWFYKLNDHREEGEYRYGQRDGEWVHYHLNDKISFEGSYIDGAPEGKHKYYNEEGVLIKEENYRYGEKHGKWKWYDSFGVETTSMQYKDGDIIKIDGKRVNFSKN